MCMIGFRYCVVVAPYYLTQLIFLTEHPDRLMNLVWIPDLV